VGVVTPRVKKREVKLEVPEEGWSASGCRLTSCRYFHSGVSFKSKADSRVKALRT
jgi:hypothetical protein